MKKLTLEQFQTHLQIECETHARDAQFMPSSSTVNFVNQKNPNGGKINLKASKKGVSFKKKKNVQCFHCGKKGHFIRDCRHRKAGKNFSSKNSGKANLVEEVVQELVAMITGLNMANISTKDQDCRLDSDATIHICNNKNKFKNYMQLT